MLDLCGKDGGVVVGCVSGIELVVGMGVLVVGVVLCLFVVVCVKWCVD